MSKIIVRIIESKAEYFLLRKKTYYSDCMQSKQGDDQIIFCAIPHKTKHIKDILYTDILEIQNMEINQNVYFNSNFPPFQFGLRLDSDIIDILPIQNKCGEFFKQAFLLNTADWYKFTKLYEKINIGN